MKLLFIILLFPLSSLANVHLQNAINMIDSSNAFNHRMNNQQQHNTMLQEVNQLKQMNQKFYNEQKNYVVEQKRREAYDLNNNRQEVLRGIRHGQIINTLQYGQPYGRPHNTGQIFKFETFTND